MRRRRALERRNLFRRASLYEGRKAREHRGRHVGGPGQPDYTRGDARGEVKNWRRPLDSGVIKVLLQKGISEIDSRSGFTKPAIDLAKARGLKLFSQRKRIL